MLNKIEGITLSVSDIKRSMEFYRDILNLRVNKESEDKIPSIFLYLKLTM